jgi:retron-type reverse transcriptase
LNSRFGFRVGQEDQTVVSYIQNNVHNVTYAINGVITDYSCLMKNGLILKELGRLIGDKKFLRLISQVIKAGFLKGTGFMRLTNYKVLSGFSVFPILMNIVLSKIDLKIENLNCSAEKKNIISECYYKR